jgi:putative molybdopterin biosynthesis protein
VRKEPSQETQNALAEIRAKRNLSASALASLVGVTRQTIYAIEKGSYIPNTTVALRLASALAVSVEDLFRLIEPAHADPKPEAVTLLPHCEKAVPGQAVQLCDVDGRMMGAVAAPPAWFLPASDGVVMGVRPGISGVQTKAKIRLHQPGSSFGHRLLVAGCDPAMSMIARHLQSAGIELVIVHENSSQALSLLKRGLIHVAGTHLGDESSGESNLSAINKLFGPNSVSVLSLAMWEEGIVVANGNPKQISRVEDFARRDVNFLNRETGAGSRFLLDGNLKRLGIDPKRVRGYDRTAPGHLAAASEVKAGTADCCLATRVAARLFGLSFVPLKTSRYDLVVRKQHLSLPGIQALFDVINRLSFRTELNGVSGYSTAVTGQQVL